MKSKKLKAAKLAVAAGILLGASVGLTGCVVPIPVPFPVPAPSTHAPQPPELGEGTNKYIDQTVHWQSCGGGFECATVLAPMDWQDIDSQSIELYLVKQPAQGSNKLGTLFVNPGGPGASGASFVKESINYAVGQDLQRSYDVIGWDPRGVGNSSAVYCFDQDEMDDYLFGDSREFSQLERGSDEWAEAVRDAEREFGEACLENTGELLGYVDTVSTVHDLDLLRHLVGDDKLNYLGYSYGTFIGALYAEHFAENVGKLVLDGAIGPEVTLFDVVLMQQQGFEAATKAYLADCLQQTSCPFTGTVDSAMQEIGQMIDKIDAQPLQAEDGRWVSSGTFITAIILPLYNESNWYLLNDLFKTIRQGNPETAQLLADYYYGRNLGFYEDNSNEAFSAINCLDYPPAGDLAQMRLEAEEIAKAAPTFGRYAGFGGLACEAWPIKGVAERGKVTAAGAAPILVIGTTGDPATPYPWAVSLAEQLQSGVLVTYHGEGHGAYTNGNACVDSTVEDYFLHSTVPTQDPNCR